MDTYTSKLHTIGIILLEPFKTAKAQHSMKCAVCNHIWTATPISKLQAHKKYGVNGCPECNKAKKNQQYNDIRQNNIQTLRDKNIEIVTPGYDGRHGSTFRVQFKNTICGHVFESTPDYVLCGNTECTVCGENKRVELTIHRNQTARIKSERERGEWHTYKTLVHNLTHRTYNANKHILNPNDQPLGRAGTKGAHHIDHKLSVKTCFEHNVPPHEVARIENLRVVPWEENISKKNKIEFFPAHLVKYIPKERILKKDFQKRVGSVVFNDHSKFETAYDFEGTTYDVFFPSANLFVHLCSHTAVESAVGKTHVKHLTDHAQSLGHRCIVVFEDEWLTNSELIKRKIHHQVHKSNRSEKIGARQCTVQPITSTETDLFLNQHHVQGQDNASVRYGLFFGEQLVAVATFVAKRYIFGFKRSELREFELSRLATDTNIKVPGAASKLLTHFIREQKPDRILSYADRRWSNGDVYERLGFRLAATSKENYWYIVDGERKHRWNYRKSELASKLDNFDPALKEYQNMLNNGYDRIWDAGTLRYEMDLINVN